MDPLYQSLHTRITATTGVRPLNIAPQYRAVESSSADNPMLRMRIENDFWYDPGRFRKIHLERAHVEPKDIDIIHMVAFPDASVDMPILGIDVVSFGGRATMCIADPSPSSTTRSLPIPYTYHMDTLWRQHDIETFVRMHYRDPPSWAEVIFSPWCVLVGACDVDVFGAYALDLLEWHMAYMPSASPDMKDTARAIARYSKEQRKNTKTQNMLGACFGPAFAKEYMTNVMFD